MGRVVLLWLGNGCVPLGPIVPFPSGVIWVGWGVVSDEAGRAQPRRQNTIPTILKPMARGDRDSAAREVTALSSRAWPPPAAPCRMGKGQFSHIGTQYRNTHTIRQEANRDCLGFSPPAPPQPGEIRRFSSVGSAHAAPLVTDARRHSLLSPTNLWILENHSFRISGSD